MFGGSFRSLHFAVRPRVLFRYLGQILVVMALLSFVPALVALWSGRGDVALRYLAVIAAFGGLGFSGLRLRCTDRIQANEALSISALAFVISGVAMAYPLSGYGIAPLDAVFEGISGVTTTGLSTLGSVEARPPAFHFGRAWLQWVGGLGVVVLALAFTIPSGVAARQLGFDEREAADYVGGTRAHARRILLVYASLTAAGFALFACVGMSSFDAGVHVLAAVSTGGFSPYDSSLAALGPAARGAVSLVCLASAISFSLYYRASLRAALGDSRPWTLLALTGGGALLVWAWLGPARDWSDAAWMAISAQSTAGFSTLPAGELQPAGKLVLIGQMLVGGQVGSTAGGLKVLRLLILVQLVAARLLRVSMPAASHLPLRIGGTRLRSSEIDGVAALALAYAAVVLASWLAFLAHGHEPLDSLFDVVSALGTVGISSGITGPELEPVLKGVLCLNMLMGRVELFAFLILVFPGTWIGRRRSSR